MKSFIPWVGGKSQLRNKIVSLFPEEKPGMYVEVFGGAGWVLFAKNQHAPVEVFNDLDGNLINLYRCVQHHSSELQRELRHGGSQPVIVSRQIFFDFMEQLETPGLTDIQRAARYYYIIRASYGADRKSFVCTRRGLDNSLEHLPEIEKRLKNVVIENRDFSAVLKTYNKQQTLFYLDPPYFKAEDCYQGFGQNDHARLRDALNCVKGYFVLSYNDTPEIRALYKEYNIHEAQRQNSLASKNGKGQDSYKELIITNY